MDAKPMPDPSATRISDAAAATNAPAMMDGHEAAEPEDAAHRRGALEELPLFGDERRDPRLHRVLHGERELHVGELRRLRCRLENLFRVPH